MTDDDDVVGGLSESELSWQSFSSVPFPTPLNRGVRTTQWRLGNQKGPTPAISDGGWIALISDEGRRAFGRPGERKQEPNIPFIFLLGGSTASRNW